MPVISILTGHCLGAGLQLALATDIRIATADCQFAIMEAKWGTGSGYGITQSAMGAPRVGHRQGVSDDRTDFRRAAGL